MAYDEQYRAKAVAFKQAGYTFKELKETFGVCNRAYYDWLALYEKHGVYCPKTEKCTRKCKIVTEELKQAVERKPDAYLHELAELFDCTPSAVYHALKKLNISYKKSPLPTQKNPNKHEKNI